MCSPLSGAHHPQACSSTNTRTVFFLHFFAIYSGNLEPIPLNQMRTYSFDMDKAFKKKWGIMAKAVTITLLLLVPRTLIDTMGFDTIPINPVVGAFITGAIFTIAIIFTGTFSDFEKSEKTGGDLAASLKAIYNDSRVLLFADEAPARILRSHVRDLLRVINTCFKENSFNLPDINREMNKINADIRTLSYLNVAPPLIAKLRNELGAIEKMTNCIEVIIRTDFIPAAYALAKIATGSVILLLIFVKIDPYFEGTIIFALISSILIGLLLISDMKNPFEIGTHTYADVDLETLTYLETYFDEQDADMKKMQPGTA